MYLKYLTIPYKHLGRDFTGCDCFGLIQLFYRTEYSIVLPDFTYEEQWYLEDARKIIKSYSKAGFVKKKEMCIGDILLFNEADYPKHLGIVVDKHYFLHTTKSGTACHPLNDYRYSGKIHSIYHYRKGLK